MIETGRRAAPARWEKGFWLFAALALLVTRYLYTSRLRAGSDETQHLHVVWAWATGRLPYRDVFDNHTPLFHLLCALPFRWLGERADIIIPMRRLVMPFYALALGAVVYLGARLFTLRAGIWAALIAGAWPLFFFTELEFRTDVLWTCLWMLSLAAFLDGTLTPRRAFVAGLLLGATFATSMKTSMLAFAFVAAAGLTVALDCARHRSLVSGAWRPAVLGSALGGLVAVPALIVAWYAWERALPALHYGVIGHNLMPGLGRWRPGSVLDAGGRTKLFWYALPFCAGIAWLILHARTAPPAVRFQRSILFLTCCLYSLAMYGYWPLLTKQDELPVLPMASLLLVAAFLAATERLGARFRWMPHASAAALSVMLLWEAREIRGEHSFRHQSLDGTIAGIRTVLRLTRPDETVMDGKGETIFRPRPWFYALENITTERLRQGLLQDDIAEHLIAARTQVVHDFRLPDADEKFVAENYLPLRGQEKVWVAGMRLVPPAGDQSFRFQLRLPGRYSFIAEGQAIAGTLDGAPISGEVEIKPGEHTFTPAQPAPALALFSTRALALGYQPADATGESK